MSSAGLPTGHAGSSAFGFRGRMASLATKTPVSSTPRPIAKEKPVKPLLPSYCRDQSTVPSAVHRCTNVVITSPQLLLGIGGLAQRGKNGSVIFPVVKPATYTALA